MVLHIHDIWDHGGFFILSNPGFITVEQVFLIHLDNKEFYFIFSFYVGKELQSSWLDEAAQNKFISPSCLHILFQQKKLSKLFQGCGILFAGVAYWVMHENEQESPSLKIRNIMLAKNCTLIQNSTEGEAAYHSMVSIYFCLATWYVGKI